MGGSCRSESGSSCGFEPPEKKIRAAWPDPGNSLLLFRAAAGTARLARQTGVEPRGERAKLDCPLGSLAPGSGSRRNPLQRGASVFENSTACAHDGFPAI